MSVSPVATSGAIPQGLLDTMALEMQDHYTHRLALSFLEAARWNPELALENFRFYHHARRWEM